jgi:hypothetical protein
VVFGVILGVMVALAFVVAYGMIHVLGWWERPRLETPASPLATRAVPPEPRLQVGASDLASLQAAAQEVLDLRLGEQGGRNRRIPIDAPCSS